MAKVIYTVVMSDFSAHNQKINIDIITSCDELEMAKEALQDELADRYMDDFMDDERTFEENDARYQDFITERLSDDGLTFQDDYMGTYTKYEVIKNILTD